MGPTQAARFNRLSEALQARDTRLLLLTTNLCPELRTLYFQIPYAFSEFNRIGVEPRPLPNEDLLVAVERHWIRDVPEVDVRRGARCCRSFYEQLFQHLQPDFVAPWNALFPHSRIVQLLCEEQDIPTFTFERGFLPDTLMLDRLRNNAESELNNSVTLAHVAKAYEPNEKLLEQYTAYYQKQRPAKYSLGSKDALARQSRELDAHKQAGRPLVLALSQAHGGGIYPRSSRAARRNFAHFDSLEAALERLVEAAGSAQVAFRDHPINRVEKRPTRVPSNILELNEGPLHQVLPFADVIVSFGSTTAIYEALLLDKPLVVVGDTPIGRFHPYVRCQNGDLKDALEEAQSKEKRAQYRVRAKAALSFLLEHFLYAENEEVPVVHSVSDLAEFISGFDGSCPVSLDARFAALQAWLDA